MSNVTKSKLESQKLILQHKAKNLLCTYSYSLTENEDVIILRAMEYIVKNHCSYDEQYVRISEYLYALDGIEAHHSNVSSNSYAMFADF